MPLEASVVPKEMASVASDQVNGAAAPAVKVVKEQVVGSAVQDTPVVQQETPVNPPVTAAALPPTEDPVPPVEAPPSASGETLADQMEAAPEELGDPKEMVTVVDSQEAATVVERQETATIVVVADKTESQEVESTDETVAEVKLAAEVIPFEPRPKDPVVDGEVGKKSVASQDRGIVSGNKKVDLATKRGSPVEREPVAVNNKATQSKQSVNAGASHFTRQLSGGLT